MTNLSESTIMGEDVSHSLMGCYEETLRLRILIRLTLMRCWNIMLGARPMNEVTRSLSAELNNASLSVWWRSEMPFPYGQRKDFVFLQKKLYFILLDGNIVNPSKL